MKKTCWILASTVLVALLAVGCAKEQDLSSLKEKVEDLSSRVATLEAAVAKLNDETVPGLQTLITALQGKVSVTSVTPTADGYTIAFSDGTTAKLTNGQDGKDGKDGKDAVAPVVSIAEVDGTFVWTINGEVAKDAEGVPYPVVGISPSFKIENGVWYVSYDAVNWIAVSVGGEYVPAFALEENDDVVTIKMADGTTITLLKANPFYLEFKLPEGGLEILMGDTEYVEYQIVGAQVGDNIEVGILSVTPGFEVRLIEEDYNEGIIAIENVSANSDDTFKVLVFASNGKGKTDIRGLVFSSTVLIASVDGSVVPVEGGSIGAFIASNVAYEIEIEEDAKSWVSVDPDTKALFEDYVSFVVLPNETNAYRSAFISINDASTGEPLKSLLIVQAPVSTVATDLESAYYTPQGTEVTVYGITVVACSGKTSIITDGKFKMNMEGLAVEPGKVYDITGIIGETEYGLNKLVAESATPNTVVPAAEVEAKEAYSWYNWGDYNYYTANFGVLEITNGAYVISGLSTYFPRTFIPVEPAESLNLASLAGKTVSFTGWALNNIPQEDDGMTVPILVETVSEVTITEATDWELYYSSTGSPYEDDGYPEVIGVKTTDPGYYTFSVFAVNDLEKMGVGKEDVLVWGADYVVNQGQYTISMYMLIYGDTYETAFADVARSGNYESYYSELDYGKYYILAAGLDENANFTGKVALKEFEKKDPHKKAAYEEFLGEWTFTNEMGISEVWNFVQKEAGVSYTVENISGIDPYGDQLAVAEYNAEAGNVTFSNQKLAQWSNEGVIYQDYFVAIYEGWFDFYDNSDYMEDPLIATLAFYEDGTADLRPSSDDYGPLEGFAYVFYDENYEEYNYGTAVWFRGSTIQKGAVVEEDHNAAYADYIGRWQDGAKLYVVEEKEAGKTYSVTGIPGQEADYPVEAKFEKGRLVLYEQVVSGTAANGVVLQGITADYMFNPISESSPAMIFKAEVADGVLTTRAGNSGNALFAYFCFLIYSDGDYSDNTDVIQIPATLTWLEPGTEPDLLQLPYTSSDFKAAALTMDQLTGINWDGYALMEDFETGNYLTEREYFGRLSVKDTPDANGEDLLEISGLSYIFGEYYGVNDAVIFDLYNGYIYSHSTTRAITDGPLAGSTLKVEYLTTDDETYDVDYALLGGWVADGIVALVAYPPYIDNYDITFDGLVMNIYDGNEQLMGYLFAPRSILMVDSSVYPTPEAANVAIKKALQKGSVKVGKKALKAAKAVTPNKVQKHMNIFKVKADGKGAKAAKSGKAAQPAVGKTAPAQLSAAKMRSTR